jgi:methylated-DNA-[protein]-cysteine S-methyltransferase
MAVPIGTLLLFAHNGQLTRVTIIGQSVGMSLPPDPGVPGPGPDGHVLALAGEQLAHYFAGRLRTFRLPIDLSGLPPFTRTVLEVLQAVPFGTTTTYGELAARAGVPGAARAVGRAMAANPLPIIIPCHRVIAAGGQLGGYSGGDGLSTKRWLIDFEQDDR